MESGLGQRITDLENRLDKRITKLGEKIDVSVVMLRGEIKDARTEMKDIGIRVTVRLGVGLGLLMTALTLFQHFVD